MLPLKFSQSYNKTMFTGLHYLKKTFRNNPTPKSSILIWHIKNIEGSRRRMYEGDKETTVRKIPESTTVLDRRKDKAVEGKNQEKIFSFP